MSNASQSLESPLMRARPGSTENGCGTKLGETSGGGGGMSMTLVVRVPSA